MTIPTRVDASIRRAAFEHVLRLQAVNDALTSAHLQAGFLFEGERIPLINPQRGIFKPQRMDRLLSIRTVYPRSTSKIWYDDQRQVHEQIYGGDQYVEYAFMGTNPDAADNRWLRDACDDQVPFIYFLGTSPGRSQAIVPAYVAQWDRQALTARIAFALPSQLTEVNDASDRRYALRSVQQRLHQASFRDAVITAYQGRCALSGLPEPLLLDAAHIINDTHERWGQPIVQNGLPLSKIHHAAFDSHLIGIDPDFRVHVSERLLLQHDGPMLEAIKNLDGGMLRLPVRERDRPDRERLAERFRFFKMAA